MSRFLHASVFAVVALLAVACVPSGPGPSRLYLDPQGDIHPVVTAENAGIAWGTAPNIDPNYGGLLYPGTAAETMDPRPALDEDGNQSLHLWAAVPDNDLALRPAILWFHGGGFALGVDAADNLARGSATEYAARGYVGFSVEYRIDTTLKGETVPSLGRPPSLCQWVQDNIDPADPEWVASHAKCVENVRAAGADALAAVRWVRIHAAEYGVDPDRIAIGGFSAGAVISALAAYSPEQVGATPYFFGDDLSVEQSKVQAGFGASGCLPTEDFLPPTDIDPTDAPLSLIASENDPITPYQCVTDTVDAARAAGLTVHLDSYCNSGAHSNAIYEPNKAVTDEMWTRFLARELDIYADIPPYPVEPYCT